jgi:flavin reductase (DIM6/NTAB) family NADH-FMN oxidoreductase RutF
LTTKDEFRSVMGHFATGVTVVTTAHNGEVRGMTANSFTSVSLEPISVLVCVNREAITHRILTASGAFCVNVLTAEHEALSRSCARPDTPEAELQGIRYHRGETGSPILDDALAYLDCRVAGSFEFGTHTIFIGEPIDCAFSHGTPLIYYRSSYTQLTDPA